MKKHANSLKNSKMIKSRREPRKRWCKYCRKKVYLINEIHFDKKIYGFCSICSKEFEYQKKSKEVRRIC